MVSIIIPLFNKQNAIKRAVYSALSQTYADIEVVIVDDGSTDNSCVEVSQINDARVKLIHQENKGVSNARNMGIKYAQGEWILFLDADDLLLPNCVSSLLKAYQRYKTPIVVGRTYIYDQKANVRPFNLNGSSGLVKNIFKDIFFEKLYVRMGNSIFKKNIFESFAFDEKLTRYEDFELFFKLFRNFSLSATKDYVNFYTYDYSELALSFKKFDKDFISKIKLSSCVNFWEKMNLSLLLKQGRSPRQYGTLVRSSNADCLYIFIAGVLFLPIRIKNKIYKIMNYSKWK